MILLMHCLFKMFVSFVTDLQDRNLYLKINSKAVFN